MNDLTKLILSVIVIVGLGSLGGLLTAPEIKGWYLQLHKPSWNPPNWIFGPVWTLLYLLMGVALYLVWKSGAPGDLKRIALSLFAVQFLLNMLWSLIFFRQHQIGWALLEIGAMWLAILATLFAFGRVNSTAAWLLVPYISWVSFAAILNFNIWWLNSRA